MTGYSTRDACRRAGVAYHTVQYWARAGAVTPSITPADGPGTRCEWSQRDVNRLTLIGAVARDLHRLGRTPMTVDLAAHIWRNSGDDGGRVVITQGSVTITVGLADTTCPTRLRSEER
jgi:hypothetical protein